MKFDKTDFGSVTIDGQLFKHDVYVSASGKIIERPKSHEFAASELEFLAKEKPDVIIVGNGQGGVLKVSESVREKAERMKIRLIVEKIPQAIETFNELKEKNKKVAACIHVTC